MDSLAPKDRTVGTDAIQYLATAELHPDFKLMYTVTEMLGAGGYGFVCIAETTGYGGSPPGIEVAVKFLFKQRPGSDIATPIPMFGDEPLEAFLLRNIDHGGVIDCYDLFEDDVMWYMVRSRLWYLFVIVHPTDTCSRFSNYTVTLGSRRILR